MWAGPPERGEGIGQKCPLPKWEDFVCKLRGIRSVPPKTEYVLPEEISWLRPCP